MSMFYVNKDESRSMMHERAIVAEISSGELSRYLPDVRFSIYIRLLFNPAPNPYPNLNPNPISPDHSSNYGLERWMAQMEA
eukprot:666289-Amorphochlora_amoeboformis.AAC.1